MTDLFNLTHESGDLSEYDSTVTENGDLSVAAAAALAGSAYGLQLVIDDQALIYAQKDLTAPASNEIRYRFYVDPNEISMANNECFYVCQLRNSSTPADLFVVAIRYYDAYQIRYWKIQDTVGWSDPDQTVITDAPHYVEVHIERATSDVAADGRSRVWIDGVLVKTYEDVDNYDLFNAITGIRLGAASVDALTDGTFYLDQLKGNDDGTEIGPIQAIPAKMHAYRLRRS